MYNDSTYQELKAYYDKTTIFNVLGVERSETCYSAFLCFFHLALVAGNAKVQGRKECRHLMEETDKQELLARIWQSNEDMFKVIISVLKEYPEQLIEHVHQNFPYIQIEEY